MSSKSKEELEQEKIYCKKYLLICPLCGFDFLPWHSLGIIDDRTNWENGFICPNCHTLQRQSEYISAN